MFGGLRPRLTKRWRTLKERGAGKCRSPVDVARNRENGVEGRAKRRFPIFPGFLAKFRGLFRADYGVGGARNRNVARGNAETSREAQEYRQQPGCDAGLHLA